MESYPDAFVAHNIPLLVLAGLPQAENVNEIVDDSTSTGNGARLTSDLPSLAGPFADQLLEEFLKLRGTSLPWSEHALSERDGLVGFNIISTGRTFSFPPRKAVPPPIAPDLLSSQSPTASTPSGLELHSPLSPLSPSSPIFPDGLMTPLWLAKHQNRIPSVFLSFYQINSDPSQSTLQDNQLRNDINATKTALARSGFKTRLAVVLVGDKSIVAAPELEERISAIKRATALDAKNGLFFLPPATSHAELASLVVTVLTSLQPICIDYYRDLTKHSRRKKGRGYAPPPVASARGTSQSLTLHGWNVRYDFKLAVFAEFRQEMDAAQRHYESALEELFDPEGDLETTPSWSPRWNDCRLLCDIIAFRIVRCQIWRGMTSSASESWCNYKYRMKDLIDRRGKGTDGYGWQAWEARWAKMMAQLIEMAELPVFRPLELSQTRNDVVPSVNAIFAPPEKAYSIVDRMPPFHHLHHVGYWWSLVSRHIIARRRKAEAVPAEDRVPPEQVSTAEAARRTRTYDTYLVPQPHEELPHSGHAAYDYLLDVQSQTERAETEFSSRGQMRTVQHLRIEFARELVQAERYAEALDTIRPIWSDMVWRREGWLSLAAEVLQLMYRSATQVDDKLLVIELVWEMHALHLGSIGLLQSLSLATESDQDILVSLSSPSRLSPLKLSFAFMAGQGYVGDLAAAQIVIKFDTAEDAQPICLSEVRIHFGSNFRNLQILHTDSTEATFSNLDELREEHDPSHPMAKSLHCKADLGLHPGQTRAYNVNIPLREADLLNVTEASLALKQRNAGLEFLYSQTHDIAAQSWLLETSDGTTERLRSQKSAIVVLPKPPKLQIRILNLKEFYTSEKVVLQVEIANEEDEDAEVSLESKMQDEGDSDISLFWHADGEGTADSPGTSLALGAVSASQNIVRLLSVLAPAEPSSYVLSITALYRLGSSSDAEPPLSKTLSLEIPFVSPFEANYDFGPRLSTHDYPDFFHLADSPPTVESERQTSQGIEQKWCLMSRIACFASDADALVVESTSIIVKKVSSNATCVPEEDGDQTGTAFTIAAQGMVNVPHLLNTRRFSLEDRRVCSLDLALVINWRRQDSPAGTTTQLQLPIPRLMVPAAEPRVLCTTETPDVNSNLLTIHYTIENPSMHFLSLSTTMDASNDFAFSGPKFRSVSLTPMSRARVSYSILVFEPESEETITEVDGKRGRWIMPMLRVTDPYFNRALRVLDAGEGITSDERGNVGIWVAVK